MIVCFITYKYPGKHNSSDYAFVKQLVDAIAAMGNVCYVICPYNILYYHKVSTRREHYFIGLGEVFVIRQWYYSFSNKIKFLKKIGGLSRNRALKNSFLSMGETPDVIYGHFWSSAYNGYTYAIKNNIPLFVATGESVICNLFHPQGDISDFINYVSGVICVSSKNRDESISLGLATADKCVVFPNSVNAELFKKMDKQICREELGLPQNAFIVAFVGWFIERKGPLRVSEAIKRITGDVIYSFFIGKGEQIPDCDNILFKGSLPHEQVPVYLNAADVFVLPTLHEGCCNAVVEAMACGLPVISSNLPFNLDVLDETNSILVNPSNIDEIANAIKKLRDDKRYRMSLSRGALNVAQTLTIDKRAKSIMNFIISKLNR